MNGWAKSKFSKELVKCLLSKKNLKAIRESCASIVYQTLAYTNDGNKMRSINNEIDNLIKLVKKFDE